ncbi:MAG: DUF763 domain-containing protein [Spirochaetes bacterium]|jgi:hypothetical protein|nr:DUF763 domain-containing protein [Spirochaetota bacterium]
MKKTGYADLPLHYGSVPGWLYERMSRLGGAIIETIIAEHGKTEVLRRLSDPFWFQAFGCVLGMDWHSSGITTSVMGALKKAINPLSRDLGITICGGKGRHSRKTPGEILSVSDSTGLDGQGLVRASRLTAKVDNTALQDGYQIYLHTFIITDEGEWAVVQQGMNEQTGMSRRYHWLSSGMNSFVDDPHAFIYGVSSGRILNMVDTRSVDARSACVDFTGINPDESLMEIRKMTMPSRHNIVETDVDLKRLGAVLALAYESDIKDFEALLLVKGLGPRTLQSLALVSEVIYGAPCRFDDPARFSFAHGGKDGHPFPVPTRIYDETIEFLRKSVDGAKLGLHDKRDAMKNISKAVRWIEPGMNPSAMFRETVSKEWKDSWKNGGRTVFGKPPREKIKSNDPCQLELF